MTDNDPIGTKLAVLAAKIADEANGDDVPLDARLDAFKHLTTYYVNTTKINSRIEPEDEGGSFADMQARITKESSR